MLGKNTQTFQNVILSNVLITGKDGVGGLIGLGHPEKIDNCHVTGNVRERIQSEELLASIQVEKNHK